MFRPMKLTAVLALTSLMLTPALPVFDGSDAGAAYAEGKGNGGGKDNGGGGKADKADKAGKSEKAQKGGNAKTKPAKKSAPAKKAAAPKPTKAKAAPVEEVEGLHPSELGKMNGALHANINAITAHIRNGQTTNGPVGLMAGLAMADAIAADSLADVRALEDLATAHDALSTGLTTATYATVEDYLAAVEAGTVPPETQVAIDKLIADAGGLNVDGTALATTAPTDEQLATAHADASTDAGGVTAAEEAFVAAWNKDGDPDVLLDLARERLEPYADEIAAAVDSTTEAEVLPDDEAAEILLPVETPEAG